MDPLRDKPSRKKFPIECIKEIYDLLYDKEVAFILSINPFALQISCDKRAPELNLQVRLILERYAKLEELENERQPKDPGTGPQLH